METDDGRDSGRAASARTVPAGVDVEIIVTGNFFDSTALDSVGGFVVSDSHNKEAFGARKSGASIFVYKSVAGIVVNETWIGRSSSKLLVVVWDNDCIRIAATHVTGVKDESVLFFYWWL